MLDLKEKINFLKKQLENIEDNYADTFKSDILFFIDDFSCKNHNLVFLNQLKSQTEITNWINKLTSRIVLKFDEESETINDFIHDYIVLG